MLYLLCLRAAFKVVVKKKSLNRKVLVATYDSYSKLEEVLFKCNWFKVNMSGNNQTILDDDYGFT